LAVGDEIVLTSGVFATVEAIEDDHVVVGIAPGVSIKVARGAVGTVTTKVDQPEPEVNLDKSQPDAASGTEEN
jgi:preprotein translocase subunit YajC